MFVTLKMILAFRTRIVINKNDKKIKSYVLDTSNVNRKDCWDTYLYGRLLIDCIKARKNNPLIMIEML